MTDENGTNGTTGGDAATPSSGCPSERAGVKTTEFWLAAGMLMLAAWLISKGKDDLGTALAGIAGATYTGFRGLVKSKLAKAAAVLIVVALGGAGCGTPGYIKASEIQALTRAVCARHDDLVRARRYTDKEGGEQRQQSDLRSSRILVGTVDEAAAAGAGERATSSAETGR